MIASSLLVSAYSSGWFPMAIDGGEVRWYSPDPRGVIPLDRFHLPSRLARLVRGGRFRIEVNRRFEDVMDWISNPQIWIAFATLTFLEIVLGVDNIIFISILSGKLPQGQQLRARRIGLLGAMFTRVLLLFSLACPRPGPTNSGFSFSAIARSRRSRSSLLFRDRRT